MHKYNEFGNFDYPLDRLSKELIKNCAAGNPKEKKIVIPHI
jgi:hypothetical protein